MPPILVYEENRTYVIEKFHNGHFDYVDMVLETPPRDVFRFVASSLLLERLAKSYPWPRKKQEVPSCDHVVVYTDHYYAVFDQLEYTDMVLDVPEASRDKLRDLIRRKRARTRVALVTDASP